MTQLKEVIFRVSDDVADDYKKVHNVVYKELLSQDELRSFVFGIFGMEEKYALVRSRYFEGQQLKAARDVSYTPTRQEYDYSILASPTYRKYRKGPGGEFIRQDLNYGPDEHSGRVDWLKTQGEKSGFALLDEPGINSSYVRIKRKGAQFFIDRSEFSGTLKVTDHTKFQKAYAEGIGRNKAFGFGLINLF